MTWGHRFTVCLVSVAVSFLGGQPGVVARPTMFPQEPQVVSSNYALKITQLASGWEVKVDGELFCQIDVDSNPKPIIYPVLARGGLEMMRHFPMKLVGGEADDHPHHKSVWCAHGDVNGIDFWTEKGQIECREQSLSDGGNGVLLKNEWRGPEGVVGTDETLIRFGAGPAGRWIDYQITMRATHGPLVLGDTKEGFFAIRTHPGLQLKADPERGVPKVFGVAVNSSGEQGTAIWGRSAEWVWYRGRVSDRPVSMLFMDHPRNLRHPTTWHARDYGLVAANPFGRHDFLKEPRGQGAVTIAAGESLTLRYRILLSNLEFEPVDPASEFANFAAGN